MRRLCLLLSFLLLLPCAGLAAPEKAASPDEKFRNMDKNNDEKLSPEEFFAAYPNMHETAFKSLDKNGDSYISLEEWRAFLGSHSQGMGGGPTMRDMMRGGPGSEPPAGPDDGSGARKPLFELKPKNEQQP